jgi:hypothetical protein
MFQPSGLMPTVRVVVSPVDNTPFRVPFVHAAKFDRIPFSKGSHTRRKINVVGDKNSLTRGESENEPLMSTSKQIVRQDFNYHTRTSHPYVALPVFIRTRKELITRSVLLREGSKKARVPLIEPIKRQP